MLFYSDNEQCQEWYDQLKVGDKAYFGRTKLYCTILEKESNIRCGGNYEITVETTNGERHSGYGISWLVPLDFDSMGAIVNIKHNVLARDGKVMKF